MLRRRVFPAGNGLRRSPGRDTTAAGIAVQASVLMRHVKFDLTTELLVKIVRNGELVAVSGKGDAMLPRSIDSRTPQPYLQVATRGKC